MLLSKRVMGDKDLRRQSFVSRRFLAGLAASVSMLLTGCTATSGDDPSPGAGQAGYPQSERNLTRVAPEQRKLLPEISGPALGAESTLSSRDYPGKVVVINVWGSWCATCRSEAPELQAASEQTELFEGVRLAAFGFHALALGDVAEDEHYTRDFVLVVANRGGDLLDHVLGAVTRLERRVLRGDEALRRRRGGARADVAGCRR